MARIVGLLFLILSATAARAQRTTTLRVIVVDSADDPVASAEARIPALGRGGRADVHGRYEFADLPAGQFELSVRKVGYLPRTIAITSGQATTDSVVVVMAEVIVELQGVRISAAQHPFVQDYERRRSKGIGTFITPKEIQDRRASFSSEIFRQVPMVRLVATPTGYGIRFPTVISIRRSAEDCVPMLWVDGQRAPGMEIDEIGANDILAVELYRGAATVPTEFVTNQRTQCGVVVVWTKRNAPPPRRPGKD